MEGMMEFDRLGAVDPELARLGQEAVRQLRRDPQAALVKNRIVVETLARLLAGRHGIPEAESATVHDLLLGLEELDVLDADNARRLHQARVAGNRAAHGERPTTEAARRRLESTYQAVIALVGCDLPQDTPAVRPAVQRAGNSGVVRDLCSPALDAYKARLRDLRSEALALGAFADRAGEPEHAASIRRFADGLNRRRFRIAFIGEFKAGKSTLVNALLGGDHLPAETRECTSVVTLIRSDPGAPAPSAVGRRRNGSPTLIGQSDLLDALTDRESEFLEIELVLDQPTWFGPDVEIVDTPGTQAAGLVRQEATLRWLPAADAVVFVTRADQLLNATEEDFLRQHVIPAHPSSVFVVVNFADLVSTPRERSALEDRLQGRLASLLPDVEPVWVCASDAVDAIDALTEVHGDQAADSEDLDLLEGSGVPELQRRLQRFLVEDKALAEAAGQQTSLETLVRDLRRSLKIRQRASQDDEAVVARRRARVEERVRGLKSFAEELREMVPERFALARGRCEAAAVEAERQIEGALSGVDRQGDAAGRAGRIAGRAASEIQREIDLGARLALDQLALQLAEHDADSPGDVPLAQAVVRVEIDGMVRSRQVTSVEVIEKAVTVSSPSSEEGLVMGATIGGFVGFMVFGELGALAGALVGARLSEVASEDAMAETRTRDRRGVREVVDERATAQAIGRALRASASRAMDRAQGEVSSWSRRAVSQLLARLERRLDHLDGSVGDASAGEVSALIGELEAMSGNAGVD